MKELLSFGIVVVIVLLAWGISLIFGLPRTSLYITTGIGAIIGVFCWNASL